MFYCLKFSFFLGWSKWYIQSLWGDMIPCSPLDSPMVRLTIDRTAEIWNKIKDPVVYQGFLSEGNFQGALNDPLY